MKQTHQLVRLRDAAFEASAYAHDRMRNDLSLYRNESRDTNTWIHRLKRSVKRSISPRISLAINRLIPVFTEQMAPLNIRPLADDADAFEMIAADELKKRLASLQSADAETEELRTLILHNLGMGNAISKTVYDASSQCVRSVAINPLRFAPAPNTSRSSLETASYVVHTTYQNPHVVQKKYPGASLQSVNMSADDPLMGNVRVDEVFLKPDIGEAIGIRGAKDAQITLALIINDEPYKAHHDPFWYPGIPFSHWRNFLDVHDDGKATDFWGYSYATQMEPMQQILDEFLASYIWICRNLSTGRILAKEGVLDQEQLSRNSGDVITLNKDAIRGPLSENIQFMNSPEAPVSLLNMIQLVNSSINEVAPSLAPVFVGEAPGASSSGRAINNLQQAAFNQLSDNVRDMNAFRERREMIRLSFLQQFGGESYIENGWRIGYNSKRLSDDARYLRYVVVAPDTASLPQTPLGKLQVIGMLSGLGLVFKPARLMEIAGLKSAYGLSEDDLVQAVQPPQGLNLANVDEQVVAGLETGEAQAA